MTKLEVDTGLSSSLRKALIIGLGGLAAVFLAGVLAGYTAVALEDEVMSLKDVAIIAGIVILLALILFTAWKLWPAPDGEPIANSARKSRNIYYASMGLGGLLGAFLMITGGADTETLFSNSPISANAAIGAIIIWAITTPAITYYWWRTTDEHEIAAYSDGASIAFHAYIFTVPSWWMAARAGWLPEQDPMIVWLATMVIWSAGWFYRKYA